MRRSLFSTPTLVHLGAPPLLAQEHGEGGGGGLLSVNPGLTIWTIVIFLIVLAILSRAAYPKILGAVEAREQHLAQLAESAERDRTEAAALAAENRRLLEETRQKVQEAVNEARLSAEKIRADMLEQARREQEDLMTRTRRDIAIEREAMLDSVRRETVDVAIAAAERLVHATLDTDGNRRLVTEYLGQLATAGA
jgi:F-type H+-transporting ATPase subunit b